MTEPTPEPKPDFTPEAPVGQTPPTPPPEESLAEPLAKPSGAPASPKRARRRWWFGRWLALLFLLALLLLAGAAGGGYWWLGRWAERPFGAPGTQQLKIAPRMGSRTIGRQLHAQGLVSHDLAFLAWRRLYRRNAPMQAGEYRIQTPIAPQALLETLRHGRFERALTLPEGWTARQVARRLVSEHWLKSEQEWLALVARPLGAETLGVALPLGAEGYCFPETYRFEAGTRPEEMLKRMLATFRQQWEAARPAQRDARATSLTLSQVVVLASMIQNEARSEAEMPAIASVYLNRLKRGMKMQCCATVRYALGGVWDRPLKYEDLKTSSSYNTYLRPGLPPGPICNPGRAALEAVLRPAPGDFLFYVYNGNGQHLFSRTYAEHMKAVRAVRKKNPQQVVAEQNSD